MTNSPKRSSEPIDPPRQPSRHSSSHPSATGNTGNTRTTYAVRMSSMATSILGQFQQQICNLTIDLRHALKDFKLGRLWSLFIHCIGVIGYALVCIAACLTLSVAFVMISLFIDGLGKESAFKSAKGTALPFNPFRIFGYGLRFIFMSLYRLFSGVMGWGSEGATPMEIPGRILGSIAAHLRPNYTTQFFGYFTLAAVTAYVAQLYIVTHGGN